MNYVVFSYSYRVVGFLLIVATYTYINSQDQEERFLCSGIH